MNETYHTGAPFPRAGEGKGLGAILLLTLDTFSRTGGIQQYNRNLQLALCRWAGANGAHLTHWSLVDHTRDADPFYQEGDGFIFRGFGGKKSAFLLQVLREGHRFQQVILGHVNLAPLALLPGLRHKDLRLVAHGVEVWGKLSYLKGRGLMQMRQVWAVSHYTAEKMQNLHRLHSHRLVIVPNTLDPGMISGEPVQPSWRPGGLPTGGRYMLTLARLRHSEQAKGYDAVVSLLPRLIEDHPDLYYVLAGGYDAVEVQRIRRLARECGVAERVLMPGYLPPDWLPALYSGADLFTMPSTKEGFGIVYLEAAWFGCRVVAANAGGVPEALLHGRLGQLIPPYDPEALYQALLQNLQAGRPDDTLLRNNRQMILEQFGFEAFCTRISQLLASPA